MATPDEHDLRNLGWHYLAITPLRDGMIEAVAYHPVHGRGRGVGSYRGGAIGALCVTVVSKALGVEVPVETNA